MAAVPTPVAPAGARHAFLSTTSWSPGDGVDSSRHGLPGRRGRAGLANPSNYRALLTTTVPATDSTRISLSGQPWYRLDGAQLVAAAADIADSDGLQDLVLAERLVVRGLRQWQRVDRQRCRRIVDGDDPELQQLDVELDEPARVGRMTSSALQNWWEEAANLPCGNAFHLYCFEK